ncbi:peptide-N4-asparagine amidase [Streptomyces atratus]|uniref:Peptide-N4-asparagine amidase A n=1 Tax=Streptomyces atratus TaxID=1893 RepID=A0A2Z5JP40_STRAR|nr:peptide-N4-asparagine amidase [Streptomyces atratus]AXE82133.1 peptide-N4-asparagine amidase A [Streptomyces atratus]
MKSKITSMLAGLVLAAGSVLGASPAVAAEPVPPEFGTDWHDPLTAAPPVAKPPTRSCQVTVAETQFRNFTPYRGSYTPPEECGDRWSKVVLRLDGKVKGRQFDRLGYLRIGGVEMFRTSTPEPSVDGINWSVEKDVTHYSDTLRRGQGVDMLIGNVVNETYTGVIDVKVTLTFYAAEGRTKPAATPDKVIPLDGARLTTPRNSERIVAEVYATGSGGGCEEFWYLTVPDSAPYSCKADNGPYREVQIKVDGQLAGIAAPFPNVWTGGWSNPFLWYVVPAPRAFDVKPIEYDLTPFAGILNDGREHRVEVSVAGLPAGQSGWNTPANVLVWQDEGSEHVTGALTKHDQSDLSNSTTVTPGSLNRLDTKGGHRLTVAGYVDTSHGRVETTVSRTLANTSVHRWTEDENTDGLTSRWDDDETVTVDGRGPARVAHTHRVYTMDGEITIGTDNRLRTVLTLGDRADTSVVRAGKRISWSRLDDTYTGDAAWTLGVPRDQRHAAGTSSERYRLDGSEGCYDRTLRTEQGTLTEDRTGC